MNAIFIFILLFPPLWPAAGFIALIYFILSLMSGDLNKAREAKDAMHEINEINKMNKMEKK